MRRREGSGGGVRDEPGAVAVVGGEEAAADSAVLNSDHLNFEKFNYVTIDVAF